MLVPKGRHGPQDRHRIRRQGLHVDLTSGPTSPSVPSQGSRSPGGSVKQTPQETPSAWAACEASSEAETLQGGGWSPLLPTDVPVTPPYTHPRLLRGHPSGRNHPYRKDTCVRDARDTFREKWAHRERSLWRPAPLTGGRKRDRARPVNQETLLSPQTGGTVCCRLRDIWGETGVDTSVVARQPEGFEKYQRP